MADLNYDFSELESAVPEDDLPGIHITKCCGNCKHFWYSKQKERRGFCRLRGPEHPRGVPNQQLRDYAEANWKKTHTTCLCDRHQWKSMQYSIGRVGDWLGKTFGLDGLPI